MRLFRKPSHYLLVEEEIYNWAQPKSRLNRHLLFLAVLFVGTAIVFSMLR